MYSTVVVMLQKISQFKLFLPSGAKGVKTHELAILKHDWFEKVGTLIIIR